VDEDMSVAPTAVVESKFVVLLTVDYIAVLLKPGYIVVLRSNCSRSKCTFVMAESAFSNPVFSTISEF
jgi:hypothetical protein